MEQATMTNADVRRDGLPVVPLPARRGRPAAKRQPVPMYRQPVPPYPQGRVPWVIAVPISQSRTAGELLQLAYDSIEAHKELADKCVLHRNINWWNLLRITWSRYDTLDRAEGRREPNIRQILGDAEATSIALLIDIDQAAVRHNHPLPILTTFRPQAGAEGDEGMSSILSEALAGMMGGFNVSGNSEDAAGTSGAPEAASSSVVEVDSRPGSPTQETSAEK